MTKTEEIEKEIEALFDALVAIDAAFFAEMKERFAEASRGK